MKNENKNQKKLDNLEPFTSENQPSPEAKSKGWERRREAQKILDEFMSKGEMTYKEIKELLDDVKAHPENHTLREVKIANYLMSQKYTIDWLDRHISKAPQEIDITQNVTVNDFISKLDNPNKPYDEIDNEVSDKDEDRGEDILQTEQSPDRPE
jgi:polyhydroxyalkanoate synthesis regulator phasin